MKYAITWLVFAIAVTAGMGSLNWPTYRRLAARGVEGQAKVIELLPKIHDTVRYEYHVAGKTFEGQMTTWQPNPPTKQLSVGNSLTIYYDPDHPEISVPGDPKPILRNETISVLLAALVAPTFLVLTWAWRASRKHADQNLNTEAA
jgi:Protein of unknown function (DUF3592)